MRSFVRIIGLLGLTASASFVHAQTLEEQLRSQLRDARSQLQEMQDQQAQWQTQKAGLQQDRDQARKQLADAQAELAKLRGSSAGSASALAAASADRQRAESEAQQAQKALGEAGAKAHEQDARLAALSSELAEAQKQTSTCAAKNEQLYKIGNEIIDAYVHVDFGTVMASRQPFAAKARVKLENAAQGYGDKLYEQRYVPAATPVK